MNQLLTLVYALLLAVSALLAAAPVEAGSRPPVLCAVEQSCPAAPPEPIPLP